MRNIIFIILLVTSAIVYAADPETERPLVLKNGSYLFINEADGTMRMVDKFGKPVQMKDDVEMELEDDTVIMMKNKKLWRHIHRKMK